jgi:phosphoglycerol transferase MdoB-like AlkP superfamily enzyme
LLGFDEMSFNPELAKAGAKRACGALFVGSCDDDVAGALGKALARPRHPGEKRFAYWLTLGSHLPVDVEASRRSDLSCSLAPAAENSETVCALMRLWHDALTDVESLAVRPDLHATRFVVVGDHSPPFALERQRSLFSPSSVPFVELVPRIPAQ